MEPHGRLQGGYSDSYGDENLGMMLGPLCHITADEAICGLAQRVRCGRAGGTTCIMQHFPHTITLTRYYAHDYTASQAQ